MVYLTHKHLETHGCILSTVATDALVLKHQTISTHSADQICIAFDQFKKKYIKKIIIFIVNNIKK